MGEIENRVKLPIPNQYFPTGTPAILAGWGRNETDGPVQESLKKASLQVFSAKDCKEIHRDDVYFKNICAGVIGGGKGTEKFIVESSRTEVFFNFQVNAMETLVVSHDANFYV